MMSASALPPSPLPGSTCPAPAPAPPPSTPPPLPNPSLPIHKSSPVKCPPYHVDHSRAEVEMGLYQAEDYPLCPEQPDEFVKSLERAGTIPPAPEDLKVALSFQNFVEPINALLKTIKSMHFEDLRDSDGKNPGPLVLRYSESKLPRLHPNDTRCRPDYTIAFERNWTDEGHISWPLIELVGEKASSGDPDPRKKAVSYLHYLMTARPDLEAGLGFLTFKAGITFFVAFQGIPEGEITTIGWDDEGLTRTMFAFIYRLYNPGLWVKKDYSRRRISEDGHTTAAFDLKVKLTDAKQIVQCDRFQPVYASRPFGTRTHVLVNPTSEIYVEGKHVLVIKDQLCHDRRFTEKEIYEQIHADGSVPGVARPAFHFIYEETPMDVDKSTPFDSTPPPDSAPPPDESSPLGAPTTLDKLTLLDNSNPCLPSRRRHLTGLQDYGRSIMTVTTVKQMLESLFDVLELLRYLYFQRNVLHRDISKGNIMIVDSPTIASDSKGKHKELCFIKHLQDSRCDPHETSVLLIDFNNGEHLAKKTGEEHERKERTGTPGFVARAVQHDGPLPLPRRRYPFESIPNAPNAYGIKHPNRLRDFPPNSTETARVENLDPSGWRHDLDHDSEAVFWVLLYWAMGASPTGEDLKKVPIDSGSWNLFISTQWKNRDRLLKPPCPDELLHPFFDPLVPLIESLSAIVQPDRFWLPKNDPRRHPAYIGEAFQRLIFDFLEMHKDEEFMTHPIDIDKRRTPAQSCQLVSFSATIASQKVSAKAAEYLSSKRKLEHESHNPPEDGDRTKRPRLESQAKLVNGDDAGEDESDEGGGPYPWQQFEEPTSKGATEVVGS